MRGVEKVAWVTRAWKNDGVTVDLHVDSDWAVVDGTVLKHQSITQASRALSTIEAEYDAVITGAAEGLGMQTMMTDLGLSAQVRVWTDSIAAKAILSRTGLGKTRHNEFEYWWLQEVTKFWRVKMKRLPKEAEHRGAKLTS